jgi:hypothetical protein
MSDKREFSKAEVDALKAAILAYEVAIMSLESRKGSKSFPVPKKRAQDAIVFFELQIKSIKQMIRKELESENDEKTSKT